MTEPRVRPRPPAAALAALLLGAALLLTGADRVHGQETTAPPAAETPSEPTGPPETPTRVGPSAVPEPPGALRDAVAPPRSELEPLVERFSEDRAVLLRFHDLESRWRRERLRSFLEDWDARLDAVPFDSLAAEGRIDWVLLDHELRYARQLLDRQDRWEREMAPLLPFAPRLVELHARRRALEWVDPVAAAETLLEATESVRETREAVRRGLEERAAPGEGEERAPAEERARAEERANAQERARAEERSEPGQQAEEPALRTSPVVARRAANRLEALRLAVRDWFEHFDGYDPQFGWWVRAPYGTLDEALGEYLETLRQEVVGIRPDEPEPIIGDPIGREALLQDLEHEMIPYSPEQLIELAERELAWGEARMREAAEEMGFGDDWRAALEYVKGLHVPPGDQPRLVVELAREAESFLEDRDLVTVPPLATEIWRMTMLSPERQRTAPFFLGGEVVQVAFPTEEMAHDEKLMSLRANNVHFSRAVVHHELIPGHHLQGFMTRRYSTHRNAFSTPFWGEGWALYWELLLWELDFPRSAEDRIGMLFWRNHRAARILFSLGFHLSEMTPEECVELLIERVGHERSSAEAEVRRSFAGDYPPLYQAAYLLGGLQLRALHGEMVGTGRMTNREFHDRVLRSGRMPIEMVRASLRGEAPPRDFRPEWRFYEALRGD